MSSRSGQALHFHDLGDSATVTINAGYFSTTTTEISIEAMVYVNAYKAWNRSSARLLSLEKSWNASLHWTEDMYTGPHAGGGTVFDISGDALSGAMPAQAWHHLVISISQSGYALKVDGAVVKSVASTELANWSNGPAALELGNFDGWIDEVAVRGKGGSVPVVVPPANQPPVVAFTRPAANTSISASTALVLEATASDPDGSIQKVEYYSGVNKIGEASSAPYSLAWSGGNIGLNTLSAVATDNSGARSAASTVSFNILAALPPAPVKFRAAVASSSTIQLAWSSNPGTQTGFHLYRSADAVNYTLCATVSGSSTTWTDSGLSPNTLYYYRLAAYNSSGESPICFTSAQTWGGYPPAPSGLAGTGTNGSITLTWNAIPGATYVVKRSSWPSGPFFMIGSGSTNATIQDARVTKGMTYYYTVCAKAAGLVGPDSAVVTARVNSGTANVQFLGLNTSRKGTWKGSAGAEGCVIAGENRNIPPYASINFSGSSDWVWEYSSSDPRAEQRLSDSTRLAACWYANDSFDLRVTCNDGAFHRLALHCTDWDKLGRVEIVEMWDAVTGAFLNSSNLSAFGDGVDVEYLVQGSVRIRVRNVTGPNAVLSGIFLDPAN
jgi:hypothetical protein